MKRLLTMLLAGLLALTVAGCEKKNDEQQSAQQQQQENQKKDDFEAMPSPEGGGIVFDSGLD